MCRTMFHHRFSRRFEERTITAAWLQYFIRTGSHGPRREDSPIALGV